VIVVSRIVDIEYGAAVARVMTKLVRRSVTNLLGKPTMTYTIEATMTVTPPREKCFPPAPETEVFPSKCLKELGVCHLVDSKTGNGWGSSSLNPKKDM